jgi:arylsulfatase A-like enzyme
MLAELFRDRGYVTGGFVANLIYSARETGLAKGFIHYDDYHPTRRQVLSHSWIAQTPLFKQLVASRSLGDLARAVFSLNTRVFEPGFNMRTYERRPAEEITEAVLSWRDPAGDRPYFAFLNYFDAHLPYLAPARLVARVTGSDAKSTEVDRYDASIARVDEAIGVLLDDLRARGELDNTIVVITSDHGEQFGEHGLVEHGNSLYTQVLRVPLVLRYPARVPGRLVVNTPVTLRDLAATITDLAGLGEGAEVPGASLAAHWSQDAGAAQGSAIIAHLGPRIRPPADEPTFFGPMIAAFDEKFHYIRRGDGAEQLFAYRTDPAEEHDLAATPEGARELPRLRAMIPTF